MKKWKLLFISIATVVGIGGAFASNFSKCAPCAWATQYRPWNGTYIEIFGEEGVDYACVGGAGVCTYYRPGLGGPFLPCQYGFYTPIYDDELNTKK